MEEVSRIERVRHEAELQPSLAERLEQRVRRRREPARRSPGGMLGLEKAAELVVVHVDAELAEEAAHLARVLDLLDDPGLEEARDVNVAKAVGDTRDKLAPDRGEAGRVPCFEQIGLGRPLHERVAPVEQDRVEHRGYATGALTRRILWALLALAPVTIAVNYVFHANETLMFVLACAALVPLAWLIGEATEHAAEHTGPGIGGFLNASFGNAPELIIALLAVNSGLPQVVKGSLAGSVISNLLLVFGVAQVVGPDGARIDRRSLLTQLGLCAIAIVALLPVIVLGYTGSPDRHVAVIASIPVAVVLLALYLTVTSRNLRQHRAAERDEAAAGAWSLRRSLAALAVATALTAIVSEILVHSLDAFAHAVGASEFFIAAVIVAIVGNAAEHGGAIVIAHAGKMKLASEIAISSSAQVALLVTPAVMLLSLFFTHQLALTFRWEEAAAMAGAVIVTILMVRDGHSRKREGAMLLLAYAGVVAGFLLAGDR